MKSFAKMQSCCMKTTLPPTVTPPRTKKPNGYGGKPSLITMTTRVPQDLHQEIKRLAVDSDVPLQEVIIMALKKTVAKGARITKEITLRWEGED